MKAENYDGQAIAGCVRTRWAGRNVLFFDSVDSTNIRAKLEAERGAAHGTLVVADMQTAGRGRCGRGWSSPSGTNVYFTLILRPDIAPDRVSMLTLVMAHAVAEGIRLTLGAAADIGIKWPNDIVINGKKVCGILTEMNINAGQEQAAYVVIGVGINVRRQEFAGELADRAISLDEISGRPVERCELIANVMRAFEDDYEKFAVRADLGGIRGAYDALLVNRGREVCVLDPGGEYRGIARGINDSGELLVELPGGAIEEVYAGEVSVRGVYGYV